MWQLYCLPGLIITRFSFLFPDNRSGEITATRRRNDSDCAHFLFATIFWVAAGLYALGYFSGPHPATPRSPQVESVGQVADMPDGLPSQAIADETLLPAEAEAAEEQVSDPAIVPAVAAAADEAEIFSDPRSVANVERAINEAVRTGMATKWKAGRLKGYAVPSVANGAGCRAISVSISNRDDARTGNVTVCPSDAAQ
jgi:hypothetical protein